MKSLHITIVAVLIVSLGFSQSKKNVFFDQNTLINKFHTINELENLKKGQLIKLYTQRVKEITTVIPYLALTNEAGIKLSDIGIKESSDHLKSLDKHHEATTKTLESTNDFIAEFIPYADTEKIIWGILYFEEVIKKIRIGANDNF